MINKILLLAKREEQQEQMSRITEFICQYSLKENQIFNLCPQVRTQDQEESYREELMALAELNDLEIIYERQRRQKFKQMTQEYEKKFLEYKKAQQAKNKGLGFIGKFFGGNSKDKKQTTSPPVRTSIYQSPLKTIAFMPKQSSLHSSKYEVRSEVNQQNKNKSQIISKQQVQIQPQSKDSDGLKKPEIHEEINKPQPSVNLESSPQKIEQAPQRQSQPKNSNKENLAQMLGINNPTPKQSKIFEPEEIIDNILTLDDLPSFHDTQKDLEIISEEKSQPSILNSESSRPVPIKRSFDQKSFEQLSQILNSSTQKVEEEILRSCSKSINQDKEKQDSFSDIKIDWMMKLQAYQLQQKLITNRIYQRINKPPNTMLKMDKIRFKDYIGDIEKRRRNKGDLHFGKVIEWQK